MDKRPQEYVFGSEWQTYLWLELLPSLAQMLTLTPSGEWALISISPTRSPCQPPAQKSCVSPPPNLTFSISWSNLCTWSNLLLLTYCLLLATWYLQIATCYLLNASFYIPMSTCCLLLTPCFFLSLLATYHLILATCYLLLVTCDLLFATCILPRCSKK